MDIKRFSYDSNAVEKITPLCPSDVVPPESAPIRADEHDKDSSTKLSNAETEDATTVADTVHYLSPVSPISPRTDYEGDHEFDYIRLLQGPPLEPEGSSTYKSSTISCIEPELQRTVAVVKPDAMMYEDVIRRAIVEEGFSIMDFRYIHFTPEQVSEFYSQYYGSPAFPHYVVSMSVGPVLAISLGGVNAVTRWKNMVGPDRVIREEWFVPMSIRIRFGLQESIPNALHASENLLEANKENRYIYPENILEPMISEPDKVSDYCSLYINPTLLNGLTQLVKVKPIDPVLYLAEWLLLHNPFQPQFSKDIGLIPT